MLQKFELECLKNKYNTIVCNEGDIILFPAALGHESTANLHDEPRTIMSFNIPIQ